ncbi:MAG: UDP-N-acetylmuramoyl-tripeptide--D-alanyl-D-alanine ligase, partial [Bacteroidia bacterium]|nr:UDP-N-acetylmuramoyl-tripeptide--D-alanyl-D-alanine ligase [Bacteroidia bacterium]
DMLELGTESAKLHQEVLNTLITMSPNEIILIGREFSAAAKKENIPCKIFQETDEAKIFLSQHRFQEAAILIKGSHSMQLEKLFDAL